MITIYIGALTLRISGFLYLCDLHYFQAIISLNSINKFTFVLVKCCVLFEVRAEFLNILQMSLSFRESNE
jgi:hypothetical protein